MMTGDEESDAAYKALAEAIQRCITLIGRAGGEDRPWLLGDYVVVVAEHGFTDDGKRLTAYGMVLKDGEQAHYRTLGLLEYAAHKVKRELTEDEE